MVVFLKVYANLREIIGKEAVTLSLRKGASVQGALHRLIARYGEEVERGLGRKLVIMLNDRNIEFLEGLDTPLQDGDRIAILPPLSGG
jgi:molybdopterin synthase sulfur carrier subunit